MDLLGWQKMRKEITLPLRAISTKLGIAVDYDPNSDSVFIGSRDRKLPLYNNSKLVKIEPQTSDIDPIVDRAQLKFSGKVYTSAYRIVASSGWSPVGLARVDLNDTATKIHLVLASPEGTKLKLMNVDKVVLKEITLEKNVATEIDIDVPDGTQNQIYSITTGTTLFILTDDSYYQ
jgi:hypothetical protein